MLLISLSACGDVDIPLDEETDDIQESSLPIGGEWYIQGVLDSYCLVVKNDGTWTLTYPGAKGEVLCKGNTEQDPFGDYELVIDKEKNINFGSAEFEDGYLAVGVSSTSPTQLEPFGEYSFYAEKDSKLRLSVGNYEGWWSCTGISSSIEITGDGRWRAAYGDETAANGAYTKTESGISLIIEESQSLYFPIGETLEFEIKTDGSLYSQGTTISLIPEFDQPK